MSLLIRERKGQVVRLNALCEDFSCQTLQQIGLSPVHDSIFIEDKNVLYVNILVTRYLTEAYRLLSG
ncbi:hypothetical protein GCM10011328_04900 [Hafnia psychrotolerans]|uniref:Ferrous iron transporter FeoA domain-containing protein n=1 Tax=Hafnia psychrotolerans TaxID=1477018 RepID=A0ABQ1FXJ9_9GAMM|nr:hypothetical protein GCM10011328_04900 [Hafnia psychrotolerans]